MLLELRHVSKRYGDMLVIPDLSLTVNEGEFVGVIGPNGAGKSTAFGLISGGLRADSGEVILDGKNVTPLGADQRCRAGIGRTFQIPKPFAGMTTFENILAAATYGAGLRGRAAQRHARDVVDQCGLTGIGDKLAGSLLLLQRKRLELARALATRPRLILLDEVAGGLTDPEMNQLLGLVGSIHKSGVTVLWIEHLVHALVSVVNRLVVLAEGSVISDGAPAAVMRDKVVRDSYLGSDMDEDMAHAHD